jgi:hypothetical protein
MRPALLAAPLAALLAASLSGASGTSRPASPAVGEVTRVVSGSVTDAPAWPVSITLSSESGEARTVVAGADGSFAFPAVAAGVYVVSPSLPGAGFVPASRQVVVNGSDVAELRFAAVPAPRLAEVEPSTAGPGEIVTVRGTGFGPLRPGSALLLGLQQLQLLSWSEDRIVARLPRTAAGGALRVVAAGAASSALPFAVVPEGLASSRSP